MIKISGSEFDSNTIVGQYPPYSIESKIINQLSSSNKEYKYDSIYQLNFELNLRKNTIDSAIDLYKSKLSFKTFRRSECNSVYWDRSNEGGFRLKNDVKPSDAIKDIFINGSKYGTECATAIVIIYYKSLLNIYSEEYFNRLFSKIYLMNWLHIDKNLGITYLKEQKDYIPGDCVYFKNPDVDPLKPEWQGENSIKLDDNAYYGHGIGINTADNLIKALNNNRKENAKESAYLTDTIKRQNFKYLSKKETLSY